MSRMAPTTARLARYSSGLRSNGCKRLPFATNLHVGQTFLSVYSTEDRQGSLPHVIQGQTGMSVLLRARSDVKRRDSATQILKTNFDKSRFLHDGSQFALIRKPGNGLG
jgi:hypothetical protein